MQRLKLGPALVVLAALAAPASATATQYVDKETGDDTQGGSCGDTAPTACASIQFGLDSADPSETVLVDDSQISYAEAEVTDGKSLVGGDFVGGEEGSVQVSGASSPTGTAVIVPASRTAGTIQGLTIVASNVGIGIDGTTTAVVDNVFAGGTSTANLLLQDGAGSPHIDGNSFDDDGAGENVAISFTQSTPTITDNAIAGYWIGISGSGPPSAVTVDRNQVTGSHAEIRRSSAIGSESRASRAASNGAAMSLTEGTYVVRDNRIRDPGAIATDGISIAGGSETSVMLARNTVVGHVAGLLVEETGADGLLVSLDSDVFAGNGVGIEAIDNVDDPVTLSIEATNVTVARNEGDVSLTNSRITLDSGIVEEGVSSNLGPPGFGVCTTSFSAGPGDPYCGTYAYAVPPSESFVDYAGTDADPENDFRLVANSPMIDAGNPAAPPPGSLDNSGGPRAVDADGQCPIDSRRDVGADEFDATQPNCTPSDGNGGSGPQKCGGKEITGFKGTPGNDVIAGTKGPDRIRGGGGNDLICGLGARDRLIGGRGRDRLLGGKGPDTLRGGPGRDALLGGPGRDLLLGGGGRDSLRGGPGRDTQRQ